MKRRNFLRKSLIGGFSSALAMPYLFAGTSKPGFEPHVYPGLHSLEDALSDEGFLALRIAFTGPSTSVNTRYTGSIRISNAKIARSTSYFLDKNHDAFDPRKSSFAINVSTGESKVIVFWLKDFSEKTRITVSSNKGNLTFSLLDLLQQATCRLETPGCNIRSNFLMYHEIGEILPASVGMKPGGDQFRFIVMADTQGGETAEDFETASRRGDRKQLKTRVKIHNAFIEESMEVANTLEGGPAFTMVVGDIVDGWGETEDFEKMKEYLSRLKTPVLYELGNHETKLRSVFEPGYRMDDFSNFFAAQKAINGIDKLLYSFNYGNWHFVVWPDPLRVNFWETHPHYFDWLERDLLKHKHMPTIIFQHVPIQPIGISPFNGYYLENTYIKKLLANLFSSQGNVRYVFSGHVHIPVRSSFKTAITYRGVQYINVPATGFRPRAFGEEEYFGRPSQGVMIVDIDGKKAKVSYKTITEDIFEYPDKLEEFDESAHATWFGHKHELPASRDFVNGNFANGIAAWSRNYVYPEDTNPANIALATSNSPGNLPALYLYSRRRDFAAPGQDRLPQDINQVCQAVSVEKGKRPVINFQYLVDGKNTRLPLWNGAFVWVEGYNGSIKTLEVIYSINKIYASMQGKADFVDIHVELPESPDTWHEAQLDIAGDFDKYADGYRYEVAGVDRLVINLGTWNINDGNPQPIGVFFTGFSLGYGPTASRVNGIALVEKPVEKRYWLNKLLPYYNLGGEHRFHLELELDQKNVNQPIIKTSR